MEEKCVGCDSIWNTLRMCHYKTFPFSPYAKKKRDIDFAFELTEIYIHLFIQTTSLPRRRWVHRYIYVAICRIVLHIQDVIHAMRDHPWVIKHGRRKRERSPYPIFLHKVCGANKSVNSLSRAGYNSLSKNDLSHVENLSLISLGHTNTLYQIIISDTF